MEAIVSGVYRKKHKLLKFYIKLLGTDVMRENNEGDGLNLLNMSI